MRFYGRLSAWLLALALCFAGAHGCDDGGDGGSNEDNGFEGTWEQIGCADSQTCDDVACIAGWEQWPRKLQFVAGSTTVNGWIGGDPSAPAYTKGNQLCTDFSAQGGSGEMCFPLEWCGEYLLYCLSPQLCEKLVRID